MRDEHVREIARDLAKQVIVWLATPEGQKSIQEASQKAVQATEELQEKRKVPWRKMYEPFGPAIGGNDWGVIYR